MERVTASYADLVTDIRDLIANKPYVFSTENAVSVSSFQIRMWIQECKRYLQNHSEEKCRSISSGDTKVTVFQSKDGDGSPKFCCQITKSRLEFDLA